MDRTKTSLMQKTPSTSIPECETKNVRSNFEVFPFFFVKIWPRDVHPKSMIKDAVKLFEEIDHRHFHASENIKIKEFEREKMLSRLDDLKYSHDRVCETIEFKKNVLKNLNLVLHSLCLANEACSRRRTTKPSCITEEDIEFDSQRLNFWMLHRTKKLSEEKKILRELSFTQQREAVAALPSDHAYYEGMKIPKQSLRNKIKCVCDELMEMRKEKKTLEAKIKSAKKRLEVMEEEIWSFMEDHLKDEYHKKKAFVCILKEGTYYEDDEEYWILKCRRLESKHGSMIYMGKSSLRWFGRICC